jgi:hypothetical protein
MSATPASSRIDLVVTMDRGRITGSVIRIERIDGLFTRPSATTSHPRNPR